jgi:hypothetical protein
VFFAIFFLAKSPNPPNLLSFTSKDSYKSGTGMDSDFPVSASVALSPRKMASFRLLKSRGLMSSSGITLKKGLDTFHLTSKVSHYKLHHQSSVDG